MSNPEPEPEPQPEPDLFASLLNLEETYYDEGYTAGVADGERAGLVEGRIFGLEKGFEKYLRMGRLRGRAVVWAGRLPSPRRRDEEEEEKEMGGDDCGDGRCMIRGARGDEQEEGDGWTCSSFPPPPALPLPSSEEEEEEEKEEKVQLPPPAITPTPTTPPPKPPPPPPPPPPQPPSNPLPKLPTTNPRLEKHIRTLYALVEASSLSTTNSEESVADFDDRLKRAEGKVKMIEKLVGERESLMGELG